MEWINVKYKLPDDKSNVMIAYRNKSNEIISTHAWYSSDVKNWFKLRSIFIHDQEKVECWAELDDKPRCISCIFFTNVIDKNFTHIYKLKSICSIKKKDVNNIITHRKCDEFIKHSGIKIENNY